MNVLIDNEKEIDVDNKIQFYESVETSDGQKATVHVTVRLDHVMVEVIYEDADAQPTDSKQWMMTWEEFAEVLSRTPDKRAKGPRSLAYGSYKLITEDDPREFDRKVTEALSQRWELYGDPMMQVDPSQPERVVRAQALTRVSLALT
jgi:hypothetical protein